MSERRQPQNAEFRKQWVKLTAYAELYDVDPRTVLKWAEAGLVEIATVKPRGARTKHWVRNQPPWDSPPG